MSAVGLMLLEDPKARARAEARIRNGTAKRRSFFGRSSNSSASSSASRRKPDLPPTIPDEDGENGENDSPIVRPSTSLSHSIALPHRKKTESTSDRSSSRNSIFGRKNSLGGSSIRSGSSGRASQISGAISSHSREPDSHEAQHHDQARKNSKKQRTVDALLAHGLLSLETVDEKDSLSRTRTPSRQKKPKLQVNSIQEEDLATGQRVLEPVDTNPPRLPAAARVSFFDETTMFNNVRDAPFDPEDRGQALQIFTQASRDAKRYSTMVARNSLMFHEEPILQTPGAFNDDRHSESYIEDELHNAPDQIEPSVQAVAPPEVVFSAINEKATGLEHEDLTYRPRLSSLPIPEQRPTAKSSASSLASTSQSSQYMTNLDIPVDRTLATASSSRSQSSLSTTKSPSISFPSNVRESTIFDDSTWEDDIDFIYEQEAEATCDFDWDHTSRNRANSIQSDGGVRLSKAYVTTDSTIDNDDSHDSWVLSDDSHDSRPLSSSATPAEHREAQKPVTNARGSSVGHRGFAAARNSQGENPVKAVQSPSLTIPARTSQGDALSPVCSETDSDDDTPKSPLSADLEFPMPPGSSDEVNFPMPPGRSDPLDFPIPPRGSDSLGFPMPPGGSDTLDFPIPPSGSDPLDFPLPPSGTRTSVDNISEADSYHSGSKHRKSSSYGSYESIKRTSTAPSTAPSSVPSSRDTGRWSMASAGSVPSMPSLIPSRPKRTSSLSKAIISPPLETLTQRPEEDKSFEADGGRSVPRTIQEDSDQESFVIRRPRTSGDRRLLQAAGRAVQRYRPATPNASSRGLQAPENVSKPREYPTTRLGWI